MYGSRPEGLVSEAREELLQRDSQSRSWLWLVLCGSLLFLTLLSVVNKFLLIPVVYAPENFRIAIEKNVLITGSSHVKLALDPALVKGSTNVGVFRENLFYTFHKLKFILDLNSHVDKVILSLSPSSLCPFQGRLVNDPDQDTPFLLRYMPVLGAAAKWELRQWGRGYTLAILRDLLGVPLDFPRDTRLYAEVFLGRATPHTYEFWGGYHATYVNDLDERKIREKLDYYYGGDELNGGFSPLMTGSLGRIVELCSKRGIRLYAVSTPVCPSYRQGIPPRLLAEFRRLAESPGRSNHMYRYHDFLDMDLPADFYRDADHLNARGAERFSRIVDRLIGSQTGP